jgi:hypothetical protein
VDECPWSLTLLYPGWDLVPIPVDEHELSIDLAIRINDILGITIVVEEMIPREVPRELRLLCSQLRVILDGIA